MRYAASLPASFFLALLLSGPALGQAAVRCRTCHVRDTPTKQDPALAACPRASIKGTNALEQAPKAMTLGSGLPPYGPVRFPHRGHAAMAEMGSGCVSCHHYNLARPIAGCGECHPAERNRPELDRPARTAAVHRQCLDCHRRWAPEAACSSCHGEGPARPRLEAPAKVVFLPSAGAGRVAFAHSEHVSSYGASCAQCHQGASCESCHASPPKAKGWTLERAMRGAGKAAAHRSCTACHASDDCGKCHAGGRGGGP
ncbi:MAG: cytochrome c3 family protein [Elusimicrobia bacterium]|nr:cytochrome c3 family protein [Elusimicrobiota bacterium]